VSERDSWPEAPELDNPLETDEPAADADVEEEVSGTVSETVPETVSGTVPEAVSETVPDTAAAAEHAEGDFSVPDGYGMLQGKTEGGRRAVGIVVSRFNGAVTSKLLEGALAELEAAGVAREAITVMPVPGAFELPIAAMALAKTRRYACIVALGCVIRGDTPHFDFVAGEAASGLQLAALETGVPVAFGLLTLEQADQADDRLDKGAEAVRTGLEMADVFAQLRAAAQR
jgi:6,7-dimethyl-8-ribityllumazine synthase